MEEKKKIEISHESYSILEAEWFDKNFIIEPEYFNCRIDKGGQRFYVRYFDKENYIKAPSFSEVMNRVLGVNYYLAQWMAEKGTEQAEFEKINSANYGTFLHVLFAEIMRDKSIQLDEEWFFTEIEIFCQKNNYDFLELKKWYRQKNRKVCDDVIGFICWLKDYKVQPIAMEYPLMHPDGLWAGTCDLICKLTITEGSGREKEEKEILAMVDFKSTLTPFFESNEVQLHAYKMLWDLEFPNMPIERVYNYGCNSFRKRTLKKYLTGGKTGAFRPYQFKDQTDSKHAYKWEYYIQVYHGQKENLDFDTVIDYDGIVAINKDSDLTQILFEYDPVEGLIDIMNRETKVSDNEEIQEISENLAKDLKDESI